MQHQKDFLLAAVLGNLFENDMTLLISFPALRISLASAVKMDCSAS